MIDAEDKAVVEGHAWRSHPNGGGAVYASTRIGEKTMYLHRLIMNDPAGLVIDHIDGDGLNCRKINMRVCSSEQNSQNRRSHKKAFKGIYLDKGRSVWRVQVNANGERHRVNSIPTREDAVRIYNELSATLHGEFSCPNG